MGAPFFVLWSAMCEESHASIRESVMPPDDSGEACRASGNGTEERPSCMDGASAADAFDDGDEEGKEASWRTDSVQADPAEAEPISQEEIDRQAQEDKALRAESWKTAGRMGNFGLFLIIALIFGWCIGSWLDSLFGTKPVFLVLFLAYAVAASILEVVRTIKKAGQLGNDRHDGA